MTRKTGLPWVAGLTVLLASGTLFAAAQSEQQQQGNAQTQQGTAIQAIVVSPVNETGAVIRPQNRSAMQMSTAQCEGLGGKVAADKACPYNGQACFTADKNGVIRSSCITKASS